MSNTRNSISVIQDAVDLEVLNCIAEAQADGEPDLVVELIDLFLADTARRVASMHEALANRDGASLARAAHALKGSSSTLGAVQVAETCAELELLGRDGSLQKATLVVNRLDPELTFLRNAFLVEQNRRSAQTRIALD